MGKGRKLRSKRYLVCVFYGWWHVAERQTMACRLRCTQENLEEVYLLAKKHGLAYLVGQAISMLGLPKSEAYLR